MAVVTTRAGASPAPTIYDFPLRNRVGAGLAPALVALYYFYYFSEAEHDDTFYGSQAQAAHQRGRFVGAYPRAVRVRSEQRQPGGTCKIAGCDGQQARHTTGPAAVSGFCTGRGSLERHC